MSDPVKTGCRPALYAATADEVVEKGIVGEYIIPEKKVSSPSSKALDEELQERLWKLTKVVLEEKLGGKASYKVEL